MTPGTVRVLNARSWQRDLRWDEQAVYVGRGQLPGTQNAQLGNPFPVRGKGAWSEATDEACRLTMHRLWKDDPELLLRTVYARNEGGFVQGDAAAIYRYYLRELYARHPHRPEVRTVKELAHRALHGESLALVCWCTPAPCHADHVRDAVLGLVRRQQRGAA